MFKLVIPTMLSFLLLVGCVGVSDVPNQDSCPSLVENEPQLEQCFVLSLRECAFGGGSCVGRTLVECATSNNLSDFYSSLESACYFLSSHVASCYADSLSECCIDEQLNQVCVGSNMLSCVFHE